MRPDHKPTRAEALDAIRRARMAGDRDAVRQLTELLHPAQLETTQAAAPPENTDGPRAARRSTR